MSRRTVRDGIQLESKLPIPRKSAGSWNRSDKVRRPNRIPPGSGLLPLNTQQDREPPTPPRESFYSSLVDAFFDSTLLPGGPQESGGNSSGPPGSTKIWGRGMKPPWGSLVMGCGMGRPRPGDSGPGVGGMGGVGQFIMSPCWFSIIS
eukprot:gene1377-biopygen10878